MVFQTLTPQRQAQVYATGLLALLTLGSLALIAVCIAALWLLFQFVLLVFQSMVECGQAIDATFQAADPLVRLCMILVIGFVLYRIVRRFNWRI